jgi:hypothetical protein
MATAVKERRNPLTLRTGPAAPLAPERAGPAKLPYGQIRTDGGTQMRAGVNESTAEEYADELRQGAVFPPVTVFYDGQAYWLGDGFHRVRVYGLAYGESVEIPCEVRPGTRRDAVLCAAGANAVHGLRRTNADKRRAVETLLRDEEWGRWSNREIARRCHVDEKTVRSLRDALTAEVPQSTLGVVTAELPQSAGLHGSSGYAPAAAVTADFPQSTGRHNGLGNPATTNGPAEVLQRAPTVSEPDAPAPRPQRTYVTRHGTVATMNVTGQRAATAQRLATTSNAVALQGGRSVRMLRPTRKERPGSGPA